MDETTEPGPAVFRIGEVARRTGVSVATLRAWERRSNFQPVARTAGGQRLYREADVAKVLQVRRFIDAGWSVTAALQHVYVDDVTIDEVSAPRHDETAEGESAAARGVEEYYGSDPFALYVAYEALRHLLRATAPEEVRDAVVSMVRSLGASVLTASEGRPPADADLSLGVGTPLVVGPVGSEVVRRRLDAVLRPVLDDARVALRRLAPH